MSVLVRIIKSKLTWQFLRAGLLGASSGFAFQSSLFSGALLLVALISIHSSLMLLESKK